MFIDKKFTIPDYILIQEFDDEAVLLDIRTQEHFGLDEISALFLLAIKKGISIKEIMAQILELYDVEKRKLENDLVHLVELLEKNDLIDSK